MPLFGPKAYEPNCEPGHSPLRIPRAEPKALSLSPTLANPRRPDRKHCAACGTRWQVAVIAGLIVPAASEAL